MRATPSNLRSRPTLAHLLLLGCAVWVWSSVAGWAGGTLTCKSTFASYGSERTDFVANAQNAQCLTKTTTQAELRQYLKDDKTNRQSYNPNVSNVEKWFTCQQFSTQLMLRLGCFYIDPSYQILESKTKIRYSDSTLQDLPTFYVSFTGLDRKGKNPVSHAINALYNPDSPAGLDDINNFTFVEPQADKIYASIEGVMNDWGIATIDLTMSAPDRIEEMEERQCRPQYNSKLIAQFQCKIES